MIELPVTFKMLSDLQSGTIDVVRADACKAYGDQRAAEARELMREECLRICDEVSKSARKEWKLKYDPHQQGLSMGADACEEAIKDLK